MVCIFWGGIKDILSLVVFYYGMGVYFLVYSFGVVRGHTFSCVIVAPLVLKRSGFCSGPMVFPSYVLGWGRVVTILGWF